jgi:hypothetical protein
MHKYLLSFLLLFFLSPVISNAQAIGTIGQIRIQYTYPRVNNNLDVIAQVFTSSAGISRLSNSSQISNDTIYLTACYYGGMMATPAQLTDTISIGSPPPGITTLHFEMLVSASNTQCTQFNSTFKNQPFIISAPLGIKANAEIPEALFYPNPASDFLFVKNQNFQRIILHDLTGRILQKKSFSSEQDLKLDLSTVNKGIYLVEIITKDGRSHFRKIVKE